MFNIIKRHYDANRYTNENVKIFVQVQWITVDEYKKITGIDFETDKA